jgi:opacity protein-like surface antigen
MAVALSFSSSVLADGMPSGPYRYSAPYNWGGVYLGVQAGWMGTSDIGGPFVIPAAPGNSFFAKGEDTGIVGAHAGIQHQFGGVIVGLEAAFIGTLNNGYASSAGLGNAPPIGCNAATTFNCQARVSDIARFGGRLGWGFGNWMAYGGAGVAYTETTTRALTIATGAPTSSISSVLPGWYAGGGFEYGVTGNVTVGLEYTHYEFDKTGFDDHVTPGNSRRVSFDADSVTARLTFKSGARDVVPLK